MLEKKIQDKLQVLQETARKNIIKWLTGPYDEQTKSKILELLDTHPQELEDAFFQHLSFGTAGARGIMGIGTNRFNIYTIRFMAQGLANYIKQITPSSSVVIGYDNRNNSYLYAEETAKVLAGNGIQAYLFYRLCPTFLVSYAVRKKKCIAGVMITASHNPYQYNGFKVYWQDGGQILFPHDKKIIEEVTKIQDLSQVFLAEKSSSYILQIEEDIEKAYINEITNLATLGQQNHTYGHLLLCLYTNLHGTGITLLPQAMQKWGFTSLDFIEEQKPTDGNFPFAKIPNPEEKQALALGVTKLKNTKKDLLLATDPDSDRLGVVILHKNCEYYFTGNEIACLLLDHILSQQKEFLSNGFVAKSIVTTDLFDAIAASYNVSCFSTLTGFKYIAALIEKEKNTKRFIFGAEESCGYLAETFVRDKDAISAALLLCELALSLKRKNQTLLDKLYALYMQHGVYKEKVFSLSFDNTQQGMNKIQDIMKKMRSSPLTLIANYTITSLDDYLQQISKDYATKKETKLSLPSSDVLVLHLSDKSKICIRPSGTEPKIKIYISVYERELRNKDIEKTLIFCEEKIKTLLHAIQKEWGF